MCVSYRLWAYVRSLSDPVYMSGPPALIHACLCVWQDKELRDVGDWRKNIEDKSGMDGRKKMFEAEA